MPRPPQLSPASFLRLIARPGPETPGAPAPIIDSVVVSPGVGSGVVTITGRFGSGRRPIRIEFERDLFSEEEIAALIAWTRRQVQRKDPGARLRAM